jgi:hypothetical protein
MSQNIPLSKKLKQITQACRHLLIASHEFTYNGTAEDTIEKIKKNSELPIVASEEALKEIYEDRALTILTLDTEAYLPPLIVVHCDVEKAIDAAHEKLKQIGLIRTSEAR